jgi:hypothetical protein
MSITADGPIEGEHSRPHAPEELGLGCPGES